MTNLEKHKTDLENLIELSNFMLQDLHFRSFSTEEKAKLTSEEKTVIKKVNGTFERSYQSWYTEAYSVIKQILPDRLSEFMRLYESDPKRKLIDSKTYGIQDWLNGVRAAKDRFSGEKIYDDLAITAMRLQTQIQILQSAQKKFDSSLFDIKQVALADLFDSEIESSQELNKKGFHRPAGIICGVILEKHLQQVCENHNLKLTKKNTSISDLNDLLKNNEIVEIPLWRFIQHLTDLRNLCAHNKEREPLKSEIDDLIQGTNKIIKTVS